MLEFWVWQKIYKSTVILTGLLSCQAFCSRRYVFPLPLDKCALPSVTQSPALHAWEVLTPEDFSPGYWCVLFKVALKDIFPFYLNHLFFWWSFLAFIHVWNMMSFGWNESLLPLKRKKSVSCLALPCKLEDMSEANRNKWLTKINFEHFPTWVPNSWFLLRAVSGSSLLHQAETHLAVSMHRTPSTGRDREITYFHSLNNLC